MFILAQPSRGCLLIIGLTLRGPSLLLCNDDVFPGSEGRRCRASSACTFIDMMSVNSPDSLAVGAVFAS